MHWLEVRQILIRQMRLDYSRLFATQQISHVSALDLFAAYYLHGHVFLLIQFELLL